MLVLGDLLRLFANFRAVSVIIYEKCLMVGQVDHFRQYLFTPSIDRIVRLINTILGFDGNLIFDRKDQPNNFFTFEDILPHITP